MTEPHWPADGSGDEFDGGRDDSAPGEAPQFPESRYELWDSQTANILGAYRDLTALAEAAYDIGRANPTEEPFLSAVGPEQIALRAVVWDPPSDPTYFPGDYESPRTAPFVQVVVNGELVPGHIVYPWPDGGLVVEPLEVAP